MDACTHACTSQFVCAGNPDADGTCGAGALQLLRQHAPWAQEFEATGKAQASIGLARASALCNFGASDRAAKVVLHLFTTCANACFFLGGEGPHEQISLGRSTSRSSGGARLHSSRDREEKRLTRLRSDYYSRR